MERQYTQQDLQQILEAEKVLRSKGLIVDDADGKELTTHNAERVAAYFDLNRTIPITVETMLKACELMRDQLHWKSELQLAYEREYNKLTPDQQNQFGSWWFRQKSVLILEGEQGFENAAKLLSWMRGKVFNARGFDLALSNVAASQGLHFVYQSTFRPGRHSGSDRSFAPKSESNLTARDHARRAREAAQAKLGKVEPPATDYRKLAEALVGKTHSHTSQIQKVFVTTPGTSEIDWEKTYATRKRAVGL